MGENSRNDEIERVTEERAHFLEELNAYKIEEEKLERKLPENVVAMKAMTWSVVDFERTVNLLGTEKCLLMKTNKELFSCSPPTTTHGGLNEDKLLKHISPLYLGFAINVENAILKYCSRNVSALMPSISRLRRNWKRTSEEVK